MYKIILALLVMVLLSGCASTSQDRWQQAGMFLGGVAAGMAVVRASNRDARRQRQQVQYQNSYQQQNVRIIRQHIPGQPARFVPGQFTQPQVDQYRNCVQVGNQVSC